MKSTFSYPRNMYNIHIIIQVIIHTPHAYNAWLLLQPYTYTATRPVIITITVHVYTARSLGSATLATQAYCALCLIARETRATHGEQNIYTINVKFAGAHLTRLVGVFTCNESKQEQQI